MDLKEKDMFNKSNSERKSTQCITSGSKIQESNICCILTLSLEPGFSTMGRKIQLCENDFE